MQRSVPGSTPGVENGGRIYDGESGEGYPSIAAILFGWHLILLLGWHAKALLPEESVVLVVIADPEPDEIVALLNSQSSVAPTNPRRPKFADLLEVERRMLAVSLEKLLSASVWMGSGSAS